MLGSDPFVHLHVASGYSMRHGVAHPRQLVERAAEYGMDLLALTDRDGVYGAVRFAKACLQAGVSPVLGVDLAVAPSGLLPAAGSGAGSRAMARRSPVRGGAEVDARLPRVTVLAESGGWGRLCRLVSAAHRFGGRGTPVLSVDLLGEVLDVADGSVGGSTESSAGGLVVLLGPGSEVGAAVGRRRPDLVARLLEPWRSVLPAGNLVLEAVSHRVAGVGPVPWTVQHAAATLRMGVEHHLPVVLANQVRYLDRQDAPVADVLDATRRLVPLDLRHIDRVNAEGRLKSGKEMLEVAEEIGRAAGTGSAAVERLFATTRRIGERCALDPRSDLGLGEVHFPELEVVAGPGVGHGGAEESQRRAQALLRARCEQELPARYPTGQRSRRARQRLEEELEVITRLGFSSYFLTVADVCDLIRSMDVRVAARGSGAGSLVCALTGISGVDPIEQGLLMERFLSPLRQALPDIDIDVESARRTEVYERIFERFGTDRVACVSMMDTYRVRHAVRDVGAALGLPPGEVDAIAKAFPHIRARDARTAMAELPELRASGLAESLDAEGLGMMLALVERLDGLPRHIALHPCGVILSDLTLLDRTPVEPSLLGFAMSQFDKDDVEDLGLLKLDVLGIRMQSAMAYAVQEIQRVDGVEVDLDDRAQLPLDDPATFELIQSTRTLGCFQIESPGQRELIGKFAPETFNDIVIDISLFRPGPVKSDMVTPFLMARQGWREPEYLHPDLRPALAETCGVVVFHEQVLRVISVVTGCTLAEADEARRALGDAEGKEEVLGWFFPRARSTGYDEATVQRVWEVLEAFASFGFCKAHAAAFALPTYQSAWLKAHHPAAFLAGVLTHDPGMYPKRLILDDARSFGIAVLGLDVNRSDDVYRVERVGTAEEPPPVIFGVPPRQPPGPGLPDGRAYGIRLSVAEVHGISAEEVDRVVAGRPYHSLTDFWHRSRVSRPVVERLILAGAFDSIYGLGSPVAGHRRQRVTRRDLLLEAADLERADRGRPVIGRAGRSRRSGGAGRGNGAVPGSADQLALDLGTEGPRACSGLPEMTGGERVRAELEILGLDASQHVLEFYRPFLAELGVTRSVELLQRRSESELVVAGVKVATQTPPVRSGRRVIFLTLDDATGPVDATFFEDAQGPYAATLFHSWLLVVRGVLRRTGPRGVSLRATGCWELTTLHAAWQEGGMASVAVALDHLDEVDEAAVTGSAASRSSRPVMTRPPPAPGGSGSVDDDPNGRRSTAGGMGRRRVLVHPSGFRQSPYADIKPAGTDAAKAPQKLWHSSPGSSGS